MSTLSDEQARQAEEARKAQAAAENNLAQIGPKRTSPGRGSHIISGPYRGMTPAAAAHAAITGAAPKRVRGRSASGLDALYADNPHLRRQLGGAAPMFVSTARPGKTPSVNPAAVLTPGFAGVAAVASGAAAAADAAANATQSAQSEAAAAAAMLSQAAGDKTAGITRDSSGARFQSGAVITGQPGSAAPRYLSSRYGTGSVTFSPAG